MALFASWLTKAKLFFIIVSQNAGKVKFFKGFANPYRGNISILNLGQFLYKGIRKRAEKDGLLEGCVRVS